MAVHKTTTTDVDPDDFISTVKQDRHRRESQRLLAMMREVTGEQPRMWRPSMVGFGEHRYHYESGRRARLSSLVSPPDPESSPCTASCRSRARRHCWKDSASTGVAPVASMTHLENIDEQVLRELVTAAWTSHHSKYIPLCGMHLNFPQGCSPRPRRSGMAWCNRCT